MVVERKVLKSISEWSTFKYFLVSYLIFFIVFLIVFGVVGGIAWAGLTAYGIKVQDLLGRFGINLGILGEGIIGFLIFVVGGFVASLFFAVFGVLAVWLSNVALRIAGGIELRFSGSKAKGKSGASTDADTPIDTDSDTDSTSNVIVK